MMYYILTVLNVIFDGTEEGTYGDILTVIEAGIFMLL